MHLNDFWAKTTENKQPGISVLHHCLNVGFVAQALIELMPERLKTELPQGICTLAALHDIGKITPGFQVKCQEWLNKWGKSFDTTHWGRSESNHALVSQAFLQDKVERKWAVVVGAHHGRILQGSARRVSILEDSKELFSSLREDLFDLIKEILGPPPEKKGSTQEHIRWFVGGLISVADWLGSNETFFPLEGMHEIPEIVAIQNRAKQSLHAIGWESTPPREGLNFETIFSDVSKGKILTPNPLQKAISDYVSKPGLYLIEGPMGCGKTEAALLAAYTLIQQGFHHGLYFGLPTQVTSNRIFQRVEKFLSKIHTESDSLNLQLVHGNSWLKEADISYSSGDKESKIKHLWFLPRKRALLAQYGVGTIDQALLGIIRAKHFFVRQFGLAGKVVILDEVHSYDIYTGTLIDHLIKRLLELGCTVLILSATLTKMRRKMLFAAVNGEKEHFSNAYPLLSGITEGNPFEQEIAETSEKEIKIKCLSLTPLQVAEECLAKAEKGACVLWIRNTVKDAQEAWSLLKNLNYEGGPEIGLLHSRFPQWRREEIEEKWIDALSKEAARRPKGCILVSTQVVEQSVDIDADFLVTELAPTDMLFQRLGRLWRHPRPSSERPLPQPESWIITPNLEELTTEAEIKKALASNGKVYAAYVLLRTYKVWSKLTSIQLPCCIRPLLEKTYEELDPNEPKAWSKFADEINKFKGEQQDIAIQMTRVEGDVTLGEEEEEIKTRWSFQPTASLLLVHNIKEINKTTVKIEPLHGEPKIASSLDKNFLAAKTIHRNIVKVPYWSIKDACNRAPDWLTNHVQGNCAVATIVNGKMECLGGNSSSEMLWHIDEGISIKSLKKYQTMDEEYESCD